MDSYNWNIFPFKDDRLKERWELTGITSWHTGVPLSLSESDQADLRNGFHAERPSLVPGCNLYANQRPTQWYNPLCFAASPYGTVGNLGRNVMVGPGYADTDFGVTKYTKIERFSLQFKAELFNIFNHPNFATPSGAVFNAGVTPTRTVTAGQITSRVGSGGIAGVARQTQFSLKLLF